MTASPWKYFTTEELTCHCGCERMEMDDLFMQVMVAIRKELGFPLPVSSGYRCPAHNMKLSSSGPRGPHTTGKAVDILVYGKQAYALLAAAVRHDIPGIGIHQKGVAKERYLHLDQVHNTILRPWIWTY